MYKALCLVLMYKCIVFFNYLEPIRSYGLQTDVDCIVMRSFSDEPIKNIKMNRDDAQVGISVHVAAEVI